MKISLPLLALGATLLVPVAAQAQLPPGVNPGVLNATAQRARQSDVLYWYNMLPANVFGAFGNTDRLELLQGKGATYDKNSGFIEVMAPGDANQNDVEKLQVKLFQTDQGLMVGVSQIVWNQQRVKGALAFFAMSNGADLLDVTRQVFPFELTPTQNDAPTDNVDATEDANADDANANNGANKKRVPPINAYLTANETTISTGFAEDDEVIDNYSWGGNAFFKAEARDEPRDN